MYTIAACSFGFYCEFGYAGAVLREVWCCRGGWCGGLGGRADGDLPGCVWN